MRPLRAAALQDLAAAARAHAGTKAVGLGALALLRLVGPLQGQGSAELGLAPAGGGRRQYRADPRPFLFARNAASALGGPAQAEPIVARRWPGRPPPDDSTPIWAAAREDLRASRAARHLRAVARAAGAGRDAGDDRAADRAGARFAAGSSAATPLAWRTRSSPRRPELTRRRLRRSAGRGRGTADPREPVSTPIDPAHAFERFVIGPGNRIAHAASLAVAELPGEAYNPLFLHGPPGLGKTHLLGAIAEYLARNHPELNVHQTTAERFTSEFVTALRNDGPAALQAALPRARRAPDRRRPGARGQGPHRGGVRPHLQRPVRRRQADRPLRATARPAALAQLAERLRDRFQWGLTVELDPPDLRTRIGAAVADGRTVGARAARPDRPAGDRRASSGQRPPPGGCDDASGRDGLGPLGADHGARWSTGRSRPRPTRWPRPARARPPNRRRDPGRGRRRARRPPRASCSPPAAPRASPAPASSPCTSPAS